MNGASSMVESFLKRYLDQIGNERYTKTVTVAMDPKEEPIAYRRSYFIGRHEELARCKGILKNVHIRLLQVYGMPFVGKTRFVKQVMLELLEELRDRGITLQTWTVLFERERDWFEEISKIAAEIGLNKNSNEMQIKSRFQEITKGAAPAVNILVFDGCQNLKSHSKQSFTYLCCDLLEKCSSMKIVIISWIQMPFTRIEYKVQELKPLSTDEARKMFRRRAPDINLGAYEIPIVEKCSGLPEIVLNVANRFRFASAQLTPKNFLESLGDDRSVDDILSPENCEDDDRVFAVLNRFFSFFSESQKKIVSELAYFPGRFGVDDAMRMIDCEQRSEAKVEALEPLVKRSVLDSKKDGDDFRMRPIVRHYSMGNLAHFRTDSLVREKYARIIGSVLLKANEIVNVKPVSEVFGMLEKDWDNIQQLFLQAIHCNGNETFQIYFQLALETEDLLLKFAPRRAQEFFRGCLQNAELFGTPEQVALMRSSYGMSLTNTPGSTKAKEGMFHYKEAMRELEDSSYRYRLMKLLARMSYNYYLQGKLKKAVVCSEKALEMDGNDASEMQIMHTKTSASSILAYNHIFLGNHKRAQQILLETLERASSYSANHPCIPIMLNSLGLNEERSGGDNQKALLWYMASLEKKRQFAIVSPFDLVTTLNNVSGQLCKRKKFETSLKFLGEALNIQKERGWKHSHTALCLWNIGMTYMRQKLFTEAVPALTEAAQLYAQCLPGHYAIAEVKVWLAHCYLLLNQPDRAECLFMEVLDAKDCYKDRLPQGESIAVVLEHLSRLHYTDLTAQKQYMEKYREELRRLRDVSNITENKKTLYMDLIGKSANVCQAITLRGFKRELRCGVFLDALPSICLACKESVTYEMCDKAEYIRKLSRLRGFQQMPFVIEPTRVSVIVQNNNTQYGAYPMPNQSLNLIPGNEISFRQPHDAGPVEHEI